jgi:cyclopropane fatty-acyl-phospholipid synthase-like methyltransferase
MDAKETHGKVYQRTLRSLKKERYPGDLDVKLEMLHPAPGEKILDIGCGVGWFAAMVASQYGAEVSAIDVSEYAISEARRRYGHINNLHFDVYDALLIDYEEAFDKISCLDVLEHFSREDGQVLLRKIYKALKKGGNLVLCLPLNDIGHLPPMRAAAKAFGISTFEHKTFFRMQTVERELKQAGFSIADLSPWFYLEDQLKLRLPNKLYSMPLIGRCLVGSVNIHAVKNGYAPLTYCTAGKAPISYNNLSEK